MKKELIFSKIYKLLGKEEENLEVLLVVLRDILKAKKGYKIAFDFGGKKKFIIERMS